MTHDVELVQLESQIDLLNNLQQFTYSQSNVIYVEGELGAGKSWLAQRFLNTDKKIQTLSFLICLKSQTAAQQRSVLMSQLLSDSLCTGEETLVESLEAYRKDQQCNATIVVDDADLLIPHLFDELCQLVLVAQKSHVWQINVILFATSHSIDKRLFNQIAESEIKSLVIQPLTDKEAKLFLEQLVLPFCKTSKERTNIYQAASKIENLPGNILALKSHIKHHASPWVRGILILLIVLLLAMGGWSWWASYQARMQDDGFAKNISSSLIQVNSTDKNGSPPPAANSNLSTNNSSTSSSLDTNVSQQQGEVGGDMMDLPPELMTNTITVGESSSSNQQRVVVPSDVVDALLDSNASSSHFEDNNLENDQLESTDLRDNTSANNNSGNESLQSSHSKSNSANSSTSVNLSSKSQPALILSDDELMSIPPQRYTLQLATFPNKSDTLYFIQSYKLQNKVRVYQTIRNQRPWYVITYQDFETKVESQQVIQQFSNELQAELPQIKSIAQVQQEIKQEQ